MSDARFERGRTNRRAGRIDRGADGRARALDRARLDGVGGMDRYVVETRGGVVWYAVTRFWAIRGADRLRVRVCTGYREPS